MLLKNRKRRDPRDTRKHAPLTPEPCRTVLKRCQTKMSFVFEGSESRLRPAAVMAAAFEYIPCQLVQNLNRDNLCGQICPQFVTDEGEAMIQILIDRSNLMLRMYGTAKELANNIKIYRTFSGCQTKFGYDYCEPYNTSPVVYSSLKNKQYICKLDLFVYLQKLVFETEPEMKDDLPRSVLFAFLRSREEIVKSCFEFVPCNKKTFDAIKKSFCLSMSTIKTEKEHKKKCELQLVKFTFEELLEQWEQMISVEYEEEKRKKIHNLLGLQFCMKNTDKHADMHRKMYSMIYCVIKSLEKIVDSRPEMFLPFEVSPNSSMPLTVRLFEDGPVSFVLKSELQKAIDKIPDELNDTRYKDNDDYFFCCDAEKVFRSLGEEEKFVEFVRTPIKRAKHRAVPIPAPRGGYCILAVDSLFELLRELIIGLRIFQKIKMKDWEKIVSIFSELKEYFSPKLNFRYFINESLTVVIRGTTFHPLHKYENSPAKYVRNAKPNGFTVENLRNELINLGLPEVFPNITDYAEIVHKEVLKRKEEHFLRTVDLFDAVEHCQLICLFKSIPYLQEFLHKQKSCSRLPYLCQKCSPIPLTSSLPKYKESKLGSYKLLGVELYNSNVMDKGTSKSQRIIFPDGLHIIDNNSIYQMMMQDLIVKSKKEGNHVFAERIRELTWEAQEYLKMFILDMNDVNWVKENEELLLKYATTINKKERTKNNHLSDIEKFSTFRQLKIYLRTMSSTTVNREENRRVFVEEVLDILPVVLKQQGAHRDKFAKKIEQYRIKWKADFGCYTIGLSDLNALLEEFDINKKLITLVPDIAYTSALTRKMPLSAGAPVITVNDTRGKAVLDVSQAIFNIFQSVVCDINWDVDYCKKHRNCMKKFKTEIISSMREYALLKKGTYIYGTFMDSNISSLKEHCNYTSRKNYLTPMIKLFSCEFNDYVSISFFLTECKDFELNCYHYPQNFSEKQLDEAMIPVWKARILFMLGWADIFFDEDTADLKAHVLSALNFRVPLLDWKSEQDLMNIIFHPEKLKNPFLEKLLKCDQESNTLLHPWLKNSNKNVKDTIAKSIINKSNVKNEKSSLKVLNAIIGNGAKMMKNKTSFVNEVAKPEDSKFSSSTKSKSNDSQKQNEEMLQSTAESKTSEKVSDCCKKCLRTSEMCNEAKKELKTAENKVKALEKKLSATEKQLADLKKKDRFESIKEELKGKNEQIRTMEEKLVSHSDAVETIERLRLEISQISFNEQKAIQLRNEQQAKFDNSRWEMNRRIEQLEQELKKGHQKAEALEQEVNLWRETKQNCQLNNQNVTLQKSQFDFELLEKDRRQNELNECIVRLRIQDEMKDRTIQTLLDRLAFATSGTPSSSSSSSFNSFVFPTSSTPLPVKKELSEELKKALYDLQVSRNTLLNENPIRQATDIVFRMTTMSDELHVQQGAKYELRLFNKQFQEYVQAVEQNILKIQNNFVTEVSELVPLPEFPTFSEGFVQAYWETLVTKNLPVRKGSRSVTSMIYSVEKEGSEELDDSECLICLVNMESDDNTIKCERCRRRFHEDCASKWFEIKEECPACTKQLGISAN